MKVSLPWQLACAAVERLAGAPFLIALPIWSAAITLSAICRTMAGAHGQAAHICMAAGMGLVASSIIEYGLHRFVLHGMRPFDAWHAAHHADLFEGGWDAKTLACSTLLVFLALMPAAMLGNNGFGIGASLGLLAGYGTYVATHHAIHNQACCRAWLMQRKFHHALHHDGHRCAGYYGVTTCLWDYLLGTRHSQEF